MRPRLLISGCRESGCGPRVVHTYSIVAYDGESEQLGVAVQSRAFSVGAVVPWGEPGVGVVATQACVDVSDGPLGLAIMGGGKSANEALHGLLASDPRAQVRQVAMVDVQGGVAVHTGEDCMQAAGHRLGTHYAAQANLMLRDTVWTAMGEAFERACGDLSERLLFALEAAEGEGGDIRGKQSAALLVVSSNRSGKPGEGRLFDLRMDDSPTPLRELRRLVALSKAAQHRHAATAVLREKPLADERLQWALEELDRALSLLEKEDDIAEVSFWKAVTLVRIGRMDEALSLFGSVFRSEPAWRGLVPRLVGTGVLPDEDGLAETITSVN
jgi:uncharacterized Ntn-hydrolase superfamily protein